MKCSLANHFLLLHFQFVLLEELTMKLFESLISCPSDEISPMLDGLQVLNENGTEFSQENKLVKLLCCLLKNISCFKMLSRKQGAYMKWSKEAQKFAFFSFLNDGGNL